MFISPAYAQQAGQQAAAGPGFLGGILPMVLIFVAFYFLMIRPQQKRMKTLQNAIAAVKKGDTVITAGGLVGKATKVDEEYVEVEVAQGMKVKVVKSTLTDVQPLGGKPAND
ncbi:preprotein translocase subunit YajC [Stakelama tenebrarum]|uniref:Sec translocon accessory complex subunit YajC n=1 Tax=Stakelama tenebrarum TaxID=2711215 RepID=A0A6G6Y3Z4_9SPHN|nr:preprotein translocase subunit YajC [Sphingosinithalassobacter tenebrarum]QIG79333.1 preprotein translocase subunit YajC [Sphingosinithalassobacter tenebrarum]